MVSSAILGAAAGTGLALVIAVTIVVYRYYSSGRKVKSWSSLDRWPDPPKCPSLICKSQGKVLRQQLGGDVKQADATGTGHDHLEACHVLDCWRKSRTCYYAVQKTAVVLEALKCVKVPDKLSEVLGDVLELACGQPAAGTSSHEANTAAGGGAFTSTTCASSTSSSSAASSASAKIGAITGVALIRSRWTQRQSRVTSSASSSTQSTQDSQDSSEEFNVAKEQHAVQPSAMSESAGLAQSRPSSRMGLVMARTLTTLSRQPSTGSQEQLPTPPPGDHQQQQQHSSATPSPQIRAYGPDGRHHNHEILHAASSYPPSRGSRSPSPVRAASLDARCPSPLGPPGSAASLSSLGGSQSVLMCGGGGSSSSGNSTPKPSSGPARCLSPLLIPPPRASFAACGDGNSAPPASPLGSLQPDLYQRRDGPLFLSSTRRSGKSLGQLHLSLSYDFDKSDLNVHLIEAQELAGSEQGGFNDPYVKLTLSPEVDARKRQTPIHRNDPNPYFDQVFKFPVSHDELQDKTLLLQVLDYDRFSRNDVVGSVRIALEELELSSTTSSIEVWGEIGRERKPPEETQEVLISLSYLPSAERLTLVVLKARNLFPAPGKDSLDPFVKVGLLCGEKRVKKKKTAVRKATRCPVWNEAMSFNVPSSSLASSAIEICVLDSSSELIGNNAIVGSCIVGPGIGSATSLESGANPSKEHWLHMTHSPRKAVAMWHTLH